MKLWIKISIIVLIAASALIAYFWIKPDIDIKKAEGTASVDLSDGTTSNTETEPAKTPENAPEPQLDGFSGLETELDALSGSM